VNTTIPASTEVPGDAVLGHDVLGFDVLGQDLGNADLGHDVPGDADLGHDVLGYDVLGHDLLGRLSGCAGCNSDPGTAALVMLWAHPLESCH
jgi:hypothetical protein